METTTIEAKIPMMVITTRSSSKVKALGIKYYPSISKNRVLSDFELKKERSYEERSWKL